MGFRDSFQYRTRSEIDKGWPDLHSGNKEWNLKKIYKVKTSCLKLLLNIKELFEVRMDTVWISQLYFQRYFSQNSFQTNTPVVFMAACVHLACKSNDQPRPLDTIMKKIFKLRYARDPVELKKIDNMMVFVEFKVKMCSAANCTQQAALLKHADHLFARVHTWLVDAAGEGLAGRASTSVCICV